MFSTLQHRRSMRLVFYVCLTILLIVTTIGWAINSLHGFGIPGTREIAVGRLLGLLAAFCVVLEIVLISRIPFIDKNFDLQDIIDLHRLTGYGVVIGMVGHTIFLIIGYMATSKLDWWSQFILFNTSYSDVLWATIGSIVFLVITFVSLSLIRQKIRFEIWYGLHLIVYGAIFLTFLHQINTGADFINQRWFALFWYAVYGGTFVVWLWYRVMRPFALLAKYQFRVSSVKQTATNTYSVVVSGIRLEAFRFEPGQYATWRLFSSDLWYEAHPFSISSVPGSTMLRFTVKASPDYIAKLLSVTPGTLVMLDGPRGAFDVRRAEDTANVTLIAGGIGITPYLSTIGTLLTQHKRVTLLYATKSTSDVAYREELLTLVQQGLHVMLYIGENGERIDKDTLEKLAVPNMTIYICGPESMSRSMAKTLRQLHFPKESIVEERFAF